MEETPQNPRLFAGRQISQDLLNKFAPSGNLVEEILGNLSPSKQPGILGGLLH